MHGKQNFSLQPQGKSYDPLEVRCLYQLMLAYNLVLATRSRQLVPVMMKSETLLGRIGVIADVQYVDQEDGFDFSGVQRRRYRNSIEVLRRAVKHWNR